MEAPNGSNRLRTSIKFNEISEAASIRSMRQLSRGADSSQSSAIRLRAAKSKGIFSLRMVSPAACVCPPNRSSSSEQEDSALWSGNSGMLRAEPTAVSPSRLSRTTGLPNRSSIRALTMPMTPASQPSPASTSTRLFNCNSSARSCSMQSSKIVCSAALRRRLSASTCCASRTASAASRAASKSAAREALPIRPAALMRGTNPNATERAFNFFRFTPASSASASSPGLLHFAACFRPLCTSTRFSPVKGTTSPMVATMVRTSSSRISSGGKACPWLRARASW